MKKREAALIEKYEHLTTEEVIRNIILTEAQKAILLVTVHNYKIEDADELVRLATWPNRKDRTKLKIQ